jgi:hypothetical protein
MHTNTDKCIYKIEERVIALQANQPRLFDEVNSKMDNLLQKMDMTWTMNTTLCKAHHVSREETAALKVAVDVLMKKLNQNIATTVHPLLETMTSTNAMEEIMMYLTHIQHNIQDILDTVCNPPGKRKQCTSDQDNEPTMPTNRGLATQ